MRYLTIGVAMAGLAVAAAAQTSAWGFFEAGKGSGVGVQNASGDQFMFKCDKPGRNEVYAVLVTKQNLVAPAQTFVMRPADIKVGDKLSYNDRLRFYDHSVVAINKGAERSLTRLLTDLGGAKTIELRLDPEPSKIPIVTIKFDVVGASEAIAHVYEACKDTKPTA